MYKNKSMLKVLRISKVEEIGNGFLENNNSLEILDMPEKLKEKYSKDSFIMPFHRNRQRVFGKTVVDSRDIAYLDKAEELTSAEINSAEVSINSLSMEDRNIEKWKGKKIWYY